MPVQINEMSEIAGVNSPAEINNSTCQTFLHMR